MKGKLLLIKLTLEALMVMAEEINTKDSCLFLRIIKKFSSDIENLNQILSIPLSLKEIAECIIRLIYYLGGILKVSEVNSQMIFSVQWEEGKNNNFH